MTDAQQLERIELDQTLQDELDARDAWIIAQQEYGRRLDQLKLLLGLPVDANIELDRRELEPLLAMTPPPEPEPPPERVPADAPIELVPPGREGASPFQLDPRLAVTLALKNRLDLRVAIGRVFDAQRNVVGFLSSQFETDYAAEYGVTFDNVSYEDANLAFFAAQPRVQ